MLSWWHRDVIAAGELPRTITRLIRDGRGPPPAGTADG